MIQHGADTKVKYGEKGLTVAHILCYRKNPILGLSILYEMTNGEIDFNTYLDNDGNTLLHALADPIEAKCTGRLTSRYWSITLVYPYTYKISLFKQMA